MAQPAPDQTSSLDARVDEDHRPNEIAALVCGLFVAIAAIGARIAARRISRVKFGLEDWTIFAAMLGEITFAVVFAKSIHNGQGRSIIFVTDLVYFMRAFVVAVVSYSITVMLTKISILIFYCRLFNARWLTIWSIVIGTTVVLYNLATILLAGLQCIPLSDLWNARSSCINPQPSFFGLSIVNVVTDVAIIALPVKPVLGLHLELSRKLQVLALFLTGGVVCVFGILRAIAMSELSMVDPSLGLVGPSIWSFTEISVGIVAACLPLLGPFIRNKKPAMNPVSPSPGMGSGHNARLGKFSAASRIRKTGYIRQWDGALVDDVRHTVASF
ncbi:hypothetical protein BJY00DRAFT_300872 [Aspergillus carlsbadensis]|nr:hypothetical protein BJY00DRAFT_300872 [Aspergillus carlsbadensis]